MGKSATRKPRSPARPPSASRIDRFGQLVVSLGSVGGGRAVTERGKLVTIVLTRVESEVLATVEPNDEVKFAYSEASVRVLAGHAVLGEVPPAKEDVVRSAGPSRGFLHSKNEKQLRAVVAFRVRG